ncbi:MAG TPA: CbtA family protein [Thermoleophilaceae bacterium]|nr:CbtA family protein [Thermoleophilaceae bacterium]
MVWTLVRRGLAAGLVAGLLAGAFAFLVGEPRIEDAIEMEEASSPRASVSLTPTVAAVNDWVVSRDEQRGGLFLATTLYGTAVGGLFGVGFALLRGRGASRTDWQLSIRLAAALFLAVVLVPFLKYPPNPPAVGSSETIADRTEYYLIVLAGSLLALLAAARVAWSVRENAQPWVRPLLAAGTFIAVAGGLALALPGIDEVRPDFPASLLWEFRISSLGTQAVLWAALGVGFGIASHRTVTRPFPA